MTKQIDSPTQSGLSEHGSPRLQSLIDEAQSLMDKLDSLSEGQRDAIESGDVDQIVEIIKSREPIVRGLVCVGEEIGVLIDNPKMLGAIEQSQRKNALDRIALIEESMTKLRKRDQEDQILMETTRDRIAEQLSGMGNNQSALRAYSSKAKTPNPILHDRQG